MEKGQIDSSVIVGIVVVLAVVSAASFGVYYFGFVKPRRKELEEQKTTSVQEIEDTLGAINTDQADIKADKYISKVRAADSKSEVLNIMEGVYEARKLEKERSELLQLTKKVTHGSFYTLENLYDEYTSKINNKTSLSGLEGLRSEIKSAATEKWREKHTSQIEGITTEKLVMREKNTPRWFRDGVSKNEALSTVEEKSWKQLRKMKFEESGSYEIPITVTLKDAPTVTEDSKVDVGLYNSETDNIIIVGEDLQVQHVIYSIDDLGTIEWGDSSKDLWEEIKAEEANMEGTNVQDGWGINVIEQGLASNILDWNIETVYVVKVPSQGDASYILRYELYKANVYDLVVMDQVD